MKNLKFVICGLTMALTIGACSKKQAEEIKPTPEPETEVTTANVTYNNYVGSLLQAKCNACHGTNGNARGFWAFNGYESVKNDSRVKNSTVVTMAMPQGGSLSAKEKELLTAWFDRNMPQ